MHYSKFFFIAFTVLTLLGLFYYFYDGPDSGSGAGVFACITGALAVLAFVLDTMRAKSLNDKASR